MSSLPEKQKLPAGLYLIATPIGNLGDMTVRAREALGRIDLLLCEDTRVTRKLFNAYDIAPPRLESYHEHNAARMEPRILAALESGQAVGLVSDSGTPLVSDPGARLVPAIVAAGYPVTALPGASAVIMALCLSGLPLDRFFFAGFLSQKAAARRKDLLSLAAIPSTLVIYESPHRLKDSLADMLSSFGDRPAAVCRELTKLHEEIRRGMLSELATHYSETGSPKGEIVVVIAPPQGKAGESEAGTEGQTGTPLALDTLLAAALVRLSLRDAVAEVVRETGRPRREVYARALELGGDQGKE